MIEPPVMLWVMSRRPGFMFNIFAGMVCFRSVWCAWERDLEERENYF